MRAAWSSEYSESVRIWMISYVKIGVSTNRSTSTLTIRRRRTETQRSDRAAIARPPHRGNGGSGAAESPPWGRRFPVQFGRGKRSSPVRLARQSLPGGRLLRAGARPAHPEGGGR